MSNKKESESKEEEGFFEGLFSVAGSVITATVEIADLTVKAGVGTVVAVAETKRVIIDSVEKSLASLEKEQLEQEYDKKFQSVIKKNNRPLRQAAIGHEIETSVDRSDYINKKQTNKLIASSEPETLVGDKQRHSELSLNELMDELVAKHEK